MEYLDFSSVITIIRKYINDERTVVDRNLNEEVKIDQMHLLDQIFASFCDDADSLDFAFDNGQVCRWFNGQARISPRIISFYLDEENRDLLSADIEYNVLPLMYDSAMAVGDAHTLLIQDTTISPEVKNKLTVSYPCQTDRDKADLLAAVLFFGMEREFRKRDVNNKALLASGCFSPLMRDFILDVKVPRPCHHFCGRDAELEKLHELLCSKGKVFVQGIAGIGKSELTKAYAKKYDKEYTNILYITYSGDLKNDIVNMDFADDVDENETADARFSRHHRHLRKLRADSLLIIDNFNTVTAKDSILDYITRLAMASREHPMVEVGISPRGTLFLDRMAKAHAYLEGRDYVTGGDVQAIFHDVCAHRVILNQKSRLSGGTVTQVLNELLETVEVPDRRQA